MTTTKFLLSLQFRYVDKNFAFEKRLNIMQWIKPVVLNLLSLRTGKLSKQILRTGGLSKSTRNVITTKICNSKEV